MRFAIVCTDRPGALDLRLATRERHLAYLNRHVASLVHVGPTLDAEGKPNGSILVVDLPDGEAAAAFAAGDPYAEAGLFATTTVSGFRTVFEDGAAV